MSSPLILITNDDGINFPGLRYLIKLMNNIGKVVVVAPDSPKSAQSHAITINKPISCEQIKIDDGKQIEFTCSGTPVDCIKLALSKILDRKPDLCISGINHGSNASINVIYSGTVSAAIEASIHDIPSIAFSLLDHSENAVFSHAEEYIVKIVKKFITSKSNTCLNVNIPKFSNNPINGFRVAKQAGGKWIEEFEERFTPSGDRCFWMTGNYIKDDKSKVADQNLLEDNYISIVPVQYDLTSYSQIDEIDSLLND
jgi:5'-nucleotidase